MIAFLVSFLVKKGIQSRYAAPLVYGGLALTALVLIFALGRCVIHRHDKAVVNAYENGVQAETTVAVNMGTIKADEQANVTAAHDEERHNEVQADISNAVVAHPVDAHRSDGPASQAALDRLRRRK